MQLTAESALIAGEGAKMETIKAAVRTLLAGVGEDADREGLADTPKRVAKALLYMTSGYADDPASVLKSALFHEPLVAKEPGGVVVVRDIDFASTCETSLLPFHGRVHIGYVPRNGVVLGLSKMSRLTSIFARRLQTQERLGAEILDALMENIQPDGAAILMEARHLSQDEDGPPIATTAARGCFTGTQSQCWKEFTALLQMQGVVVPADTVPDAQRHHAADSAADGAALPPSNGFNSALSDAGSLSDGEASSSSGGSPTFRKAEVEALATAEMQDAVRTILHAIGEDPDRKGLQGTAHRYVKWFLRTTEGFWGQLDRHKARCCPAGVPAHLVPIASTTELPTAPGTPASIDRPTKEACANGGTAGAPSSCAAGSFCVVRVPFASQCEHHLLPFYGHATVVLLPAAAEGAGAPGALAGLPDMHHTVRTYAKRLQIQERLTSELADALLGDAEGGAGLAGLLVVCDAAHMCMVARGVEKAASGTTTYAVRGLLASDAALRIQAMTAAAKVKQSRPL
mmetsp:Transcript_36718/g.92802  ORF Transcript_36718/g.92802 Transcript_36718/m.92802 type:complete len:515 (+) Transcript_36718:156-1700(+)